MNHRPCSFRGCTTWLLAALVLAGTTICRLPAEAVPYATLHTFNAACDGYEPSGNLIYASDGNYYGATILGGTNGMGTIFEMTPAGVITTLLSITNSAQGEDPRAWIIEGADGNLYGTMHDGGPNAGGVVWKLTLPGHQYSIVHGFNLNNNSGSGPMDGLVEDSGGNLYGTLELAGANGFGAIFKVNIATGTYTDLYDFTSSDSYGLSYCPMVLSGSTLYGASYEAGADFRGSIFRISTSGSGYLRLYDFNDATGNVGYHPAALLLGKDGNLYGALISGGEYGDGSIFMMSPSPISDFPQVIHSFTGGADGSFPASLLQDSSGNLYGMASQGGIDVNGQVGNGVVFKMNTSGSSFVPLGTQLNSGVDGYESFGYIAFGPGHTIVSEDIFQTGAPAYFGTIFQTNTSGTVPTLLHSFYTDGVFDGIEPQYGSIVHASDGYYYGTTVAAKYAWSGTLYKFNAAGDYSTAHYFDNNLNSDMDGASPSGQPIIGFNGDLIGLTYAGSTNNQGMAYDFNTTDQTERVLSVLGGSSGANSYSNVIRGDDGNYYATTSMGGQHNAGAIIEIKPSGVEQAVYSFVGPSDGSAPFGSIFESHGTIYGTCQAGGASGNGTAWSWNNTAGLLPIKTFDMSTDGSQPGGVIQGLDGTIYGALYYSSAGAGMIYSMSKTGSNFTVVHNFISATDGGNPPGAPFQGSTGKLYGVCYQAGASSYGTVWQMAPTGANFKVLHAFANGGVDGANPYGTPMEGPDGNLYGTTSQGGVAPVSGTAVSGTIYKLGTALPVIDSIIDHRTGGPSGVDGDSVEIKGANFLGVTEVQFSGIGATFSRLSSNLIKAVVPGTASTGPVTVAAANGTATSSFSFTILAPTIIDFSPDFGLVGTPITLSGSNFYAVTSVSLGGEPVSDYVVESSASIRFSAPANATSGLIKVTTASGSATSSYPFAYFPPTVKSFKPASGPVGTAVTITGSNFAGVTEVKFDGTASTNVVVHSTTSITATVPTGAASGPIAVTTPGGTATSTATFMVD